MESTARTRLALWVTVISVAGALALSGCSKDGSSPASGTGTATTTPPAGAPAGPPPPVDTHAPTAALTTLPAIGPGKAATLVSGVTVTAGKASVVQVTGQGPGETSGSAASVRLTVKNTSGAAVSLDDLAVTASYGKGTPATHSTASPAKDLAGSLAAGGSATGTYVFLLPKTELSSLKIEVSSSRAPNILIFQQ